MISDRVLRQAAHEASGIMMESILAEVQGDYQFSPMFEKKMNSLIKKTKRHGYHSVLTRVAGVLLALMLTGTAWLSVDAEARAVFTGWVKHICDTHFTYSFTGEKTENSEIKDYRPTRLPEDWEVIDSWTDEIGTTIVYMDSNGSVSYFSVTTSSYTTVSIGEVRDPIIVNMKKGSAEFYAGTTEEDSHALVWSEEDILFHLIAHLSCDELVEIAESVEN